METLKITEKSLKDLKNQYQTSLDNNEESFIFQEKEILTAYAKYMIEYLEPKFKNE